MTAQRETKYARSGDASIAYQFMGDGPIDVLMTSFLNISIDAFDREPHLERFLERLGSYTRIVLFDRRGIGLSDPISLDSPPTLEQDVEDAIAVLDAVGSDKVHLVGAFMAAPTMMLLAATHPGRTGSLVLCNAFPRVFRADDYPYGLHTDMKERLEHAVDEVVDEASSTAFVHAPSLNGDDRFREWWDEQGRRGASPATAKVLNRLRLATDVREVLPSIRVPTLVLSRRYGGLGQYVADHIEGSKFVQLEGNDNFPFAQDGDTVIEEIEEFLTGSRRYHEPNRVLATILFTDICSSTQRAVGLGDREWRELLDRHDAMARRQIERFGGREIKTTGDGFLASFDGPARAVRCAAAMRDGARQLGVEIRAGVHIGEIELRGEDVSGIAVHTAQRVSGMAGASEVLVSRTVTDLVAGSGLQFDSRGEHELKGVPGSWQLYAVR